MMRHLGATTLAFLSILGSPAPAQDAVPAAKESGATAHQALPTMGIYGFKLGQARVTTLSDGSIPLDIHAVLRNAPKATLDGLLRDAFADNPVETSINAYLIEDGDRKILVDTGAGDLFGPAGGKLLRSLEAAGVRPEQVTDVLITHVHTDHSGGLARDDAPVFPKARVHVAKADVDLFTGPRLPSDMPVRLHDEAVAALGPYARSGQLQPFSGRRVLLPGLNAIPTPGHTPGHTIYRFESDGQSIEFWGDLVHVGAVQFPRPEVTITFDADQPAARDQRLAQFRRAAETKVLVAGAHLGFPGVGHIKRLGQGYAWVPVPFRYRD
ncbi:MBL fold metallo-hydrolase [Sphingomonas sp. OTU376]|uniref:MBL fold metallo-hydrolase n=1 Tax=Sphingomonas sp. OTU376 TaxID=3043863 RepID=UPI00313D798B